MDYNIKLNENEVNKVINALASLPYRDSFEVIGNITNQVNTQALRSKEPVETK